MTKERGHSPVTSKVTQGHCPIDQKLMLLSFSILNEKFIEDFLLIKQQVNSNFKVISASKTDTAVVDNANMPYAKVQIIRHEKPVLMITSIKYIYLSVFLYHIA